MAALRNKRDTVLLTTSCGLNLNHDAIFVDASGNNITLTLPNAQPLDGINFVFNRLDASNNRVTIIGHNANQTVNHHASIQLGTNSTMTLLAFGGQWYLTN